MSGQNLDLKHSFAAFLVVGVLCGLLGWFFLKAGRLRRELEQANSNWTHKQAEHERQIAALKPNVPDPQPESPPAATTTVAPVPLRESSASVLRRVPHIASFILTRGAVRVPTENPDLGKPLLIQRGTFLVRLRVDLAPNEYAAYGVSIRQVGEQESSFQTVSENQPSSAKSIWVDVPSSILHSGDYILKVTGSDSLKEEQILAFHHISVVNQTAGGRKN